MKFLCFGNHCGIILREKAEMPENKKIVELDCGKYPDVIGTSLKLSGTEKDVFETALKIATDVNGHQNTPELRKQIRSYIKQNQFY